MAVKEAQAGLDGVLQVAVRFTEKDATVRYLPRKVALPQILMRYDDTPFDVNPAGAVVSVARSKQGTVRGWSERRENSESASAADAAEDTAEKDLIGPSPIDVIVEWHPAAEVRLTESTRLSFSGLDAEGLKLLEAFREEERLPHSSSHRYIARVAEAVALKPGDLVLPVHYDVASVDVSTMPHNETGTLDVVVRTLRTPSHDRGVPTGVALIDGALELRLGHLCDQSGCVEHFHESLGEIGGLAAVQPHPSLEDPRAVLHLRAGQPVDLWNLREKLRHRSVEPASLVPRGPASYRLRVDLPRWRTDKPSEDVQQCLVCRDRTLQLLEELPWTQAAEVAGGGISFRPTKLDCDLVPLLDAIANSGTAPISVWFVPAGVPMPKAAPARLATEGTTPKNAGSNAHPVVEFSFGHTCDVGTNPLAVLGQRAWSSRTNKESLRPNTIVRATIDDRKFANLTSVFDEFQSAGHLPRETRLREFGDVRIELEFAHICGEVEYSKPPKKKAKTDSKKETKHNHTDSNPSQADEKPTEDKRSPKKPFVPKPVRPAKSSHGRQAIETALERIDWLQEAVFQDYHTKPKFTSPRKLTVSLQIEGDDVVIIDQLMQSLRSAGFPPQSVVVSRRFPGIPFGKPLPADLQVADRQGMRYPLSLLKKPGRPLAVAFVSLKCPRHEKYQADPQLFEYQVRTIERFNDRVEFVAVSANPQDQFADVVEFWSKTQLPVPLLHDADGQTRSVFNAQVTPPPHWFVFDAEGRLRYAGEPHDNWEKPDKEKDDFLGRALDLVLAGKYQANGAVFFNKSLCNCSDPNCKCPKCGCGATCRCTIKH